MRDPTPLHRGYRVLSRLLMLPMLAWLWWRGRKEPGYRSRMGERLGFLRPRPASSGCILIQAASVGEVQAARPLIQALRGRWPDHALLVSTHTPTGAATLHNHWGDDIAHVFSPLDTPGACGRFLDRLQPRMLVLLERELWPEMLLQCRQRAIPVVLVNARLSDHSLRLYQRWPGLMAPIWSQLALVAAADGASMDRLQALGIPPQRLVNTGNLKFDTPPPAADAQPVPPWLIGRTVIVAGSTHEAEETALLSAWPAWQVRHPGALLILVPRHPQRFEAVADRLARLGLIHARHSLGETPTPQTQVLLGDTMGELSHWYRLSTVCFIGGTLAPVGGHNPLEALALSKPVLFGPHIRNAQTLFEAIEAAGAGQRVVDADELLATAEAWIAHPEGLNQKARRATEFMRLHQGATQRCMQSLEPLLGNPPAPLQCVEVQQETFWFDDSRLPDIQPAQFTPPPISSAQGVLATGSGRGQAHLVNIAGHPAVLRHYRRGGLMARLSKDQYWRKPAGHSRAMREFALLRFMRSWGLPVPAPLAARHQPGGWFYRADILVELIPDSQNVAQCLSQRPLEPGEWRALGLAIRQLHDRQIFHADLNCHNLLLDARGMAWVVDFDRCEIRPGTPWKEANLARLQRSLRKEKGKRPVFHWGDDEWAHLTHGYHSI